MKPDLQCEAERIRAEYKRREREISSNFYALYHPSNLFIRHSQQRALLQALRSANLLPLKDRSILEVGCGAGGWLTILWYDFYVKNPCNPHVRRIGRAEIKSLFPGCRVVLRHTTLAPPLARRFVPISWTLAAFFDDLRIFNTCYFGILQRDK